MERVRRGLIFMLAAAVLTTGCGGDDARDQAPRGARALSAPAVKLRADLAGALAARAWLTAFSVRATLTDGATSPTARAARRTLGEGSKALAARLAVAFGGKTATDALVLLRRQDRLWVAIARARASGNPVAGTVADVGLDANRTALAKTLAIDGLTAGELGEQLEPGDTSLAAAVGAVAAGAPRAPARTAVAAARAARPATALAVAAARRRPQITGGATSPAAELAALAASAFTDDTYAQAATDAVVVAGARRGGRLRAATSTLDETTDALGQVVASVYGEDAGRRFAALWSAHTVAFSDYARAKANADAVVAQRALLALKRFRAGTLRLLDELDPEGPRRRLSAALTKHVDTATAAIRAQATDSPKLGPRLLVAARAARAVGRALAMRFARQFPEKLPAS